MTLSRSDWRLLLVPAVGYFIDLYDLFLLPIVRVDSLKELGVSAGSSLGVYTMIMNCQLAGMTLGALFLWGPIADRRGRREILIVSIMLYSIGSIFTAGVHTKEEYALIRFVTGLGLGGELGAAVTLVSENLPHKRSLAGAVIGFAGMLGVVSAALLARMGVGWRSAYIIGGILGLVILFLRLSLKESVLFLREKEKENQPGYLDRLFYLCRWKQVYRMMACVLVGTPTYFVVGLVVPGAPEFARAMGMSQSPRPSTALICTYCAIAVGDIACGLFSVWKQSRKGALLLFQIMTLLGIASLVFFPPKDVAGFYVRCMITGFGLGLWGNMVLNAAEQFGTNVRATVTIAVPNFARLMLYPISFFFLMLKPRLGVLGAAEIVGFSCSLMAIGAVLLLKDNYHSNLNYNESIPISNGAKSYAHRTANPNWLQRLLRGSFHKTGS